MKKTLRFSLLGLALMLAGNIMAQKTVTIDFDADYCKMVDDITAADIQRMAKRILDAKRCTEVTMLSE